MTELREELAGFYVEEYVYPSDFGQVLETDMRVNDVMGEGV